VYHCTPSTRGTCLCLIAYRQRVCQDVRSNSVMTQTTRIRDADADDDDDARMQDLD
jgi:hypothetical protein